MVRAATEAGLSPMGAVSIQVYGLNRTGLVQARTRVPAAAAASVPG